MKKIIAAAFLVFLAAILLLGSCGGAMTRTTIPSTTQTRPPTYTTATMTHLPSSTMTTSSMPMPGTTSAGTIGLATGGAKDINSFRENIENDFLPLPTDISYEGLFYDYYFDTGAVEGTDKLFAPSYSYAVTRDPLSHQTEYYLSVGLNSGIRQEDFHRKILNMVIVLDSSGSMGEYYNEYYYDNKGNVCLAYEGEGAHLNKISSARNAVVSILNQLNGNDRFAIVQFNSNASVVKSMGLVDDTNMNRVKNDVMNIEAGGSTDLSAGFHLAADQFRKVREVNSYEYENRIIVLTDAQPNTGEFSSSGLSDIITRNAKSRIYTTFVGIGVDFNTELMELTTKTKGANYYTVRSPREFRQRVDDEFEYMVTPLVFDVNFLLQSDDWKIDTVFGSPEADSATGRLMTINTLFPSKSEGGEARGGLVLLKLKKISANADGPIFLRVTYEDRDGRTDGAEEVIRLETTSPEYFGNSGIRKGILLTRYAALLKNWMTDERQHIQYHSGWDSSINENSGIRIPGAINLSEWERQSLPLVVSSPYGWIFDKFSKYFEDEMTAIDDNTLEQEVNVLDLLSTY